MSRRVRSWACSLEVVQVDELFVRHYVLQIYEGRNSMTFAYCPTILASAVVITMRLHFLQRNENDV